MDWGAAICIFSAKLSLVMIGESGSSFKSWILTLLNGMVRWFLSNISLNTIIPVITDPERSSWASRVSSICLMFVERNFSADLFSISEIDTFCLLLNSRTISSYRDEFKKFSIETKRALGAFRFALSYSSAWVTIDVFESSTSWLIAWLVTVWGESTSYAFFLKIEAPVTLDPIPAPRAKMIFCTPGNVAP